MNTNIESALTALIGNDPRFQRAMAMLNGKTPVEMQQVVMNMISTQGMPQEQLAPLISNIKQQFAMFGIQL